MQRPLVASLLATFGLTVTGCFEAPPPPPRMPSSKYLYPETVTADVFKDDAPANAELQPDSFPSKFVDCTGKPVDLAQYRGQKNVILVMLRGYNGAHCPYCTAQTNSLFHNKAELDKFDAQLLVVYPGQSTMLDEFLTKAGSTIKTAPCPILLDENFQAVDQLGIRGELAKPSTYIIDKQGQVRYAYVGASLSDRPSVKAILTQLQALQPKPTKS